MGFTYKYKETHTAVMVNCWNEKLEVVVIENKPSEFKKLAEKVNRKSKQTGMSVKDLERYAKQNKLTWHECMMDLIRNLKENEFDEMEGEVYFEYLNKYIHLVYVKDIDYTYVKKVANYLNKIDEKIMNKLVEYSIKYCNDMISNYPDVEYKEGLCNLKNPIDILNYLEVNRLKIDEFSDENSNVLNLSGSCEWDRYELYSKRSLSTYKKLCI